VSKIQIQFKDPDAIWEIVNSKHPFPEDEDDITPRMAKQREDFSREYFEYGDYGVIEIDPATMECKLLPRREWNGR
jgi:hypothetical protein